MIIEEIIQKYSPKLDYFDLEILIANSLGKTREFVLMHPEYKIQKSQISNLKSQINRRIAKEPIAYILGHKEFYGLDFIVNKYTLVPRPETELMVELALAEISNLKSQISNLSVIDIGTGSGCIIISIAKNLDSHFHGYDKIKYYTVDISKEALKIAEKNAKIHGASKKIKFLHGSLLEPFIEKCKLSPPTGGENSTMIILANLPYLSKEIYQSAPIDVKKFEPKSALYSPEAGLKHYRKLLEELKLINNKLYKIHTTCFFEISPEQKLPITKLIKTIFPKAKISFTKDLAGKWRICGIEF